VLAKVVIDNHVLRGMIGAEIFVRFGLFFRFEQEAERSRADEDGDAMHVFLH
jgi:hypothetical protein